MRTLFERLNMRLRGGSLTGQWLHEYHACKVVKVHPGDYVDGDAQSMVNRVTSSLDPTVTPVANNREERGISLLRHRYYL